MADDWRNGGFGLYVHWPFCEAKCPYCDFNSHVARTIDHQSWKRAFVEELDRSARDTKGRVLNSIFFGGGTPSLMDPATVTAIIDAAGGHWQFANDIEITLEANPSSVEAQKFHDFRFAGVNRVSLGIQALNDQDLRALGRLHSVDEAFTALDVAQDTFDRVSFDLIYGRQNQSLKDWEIELRQALKRGTDHLSLYQLTIEPETAFGDRYAAGKLRGLPSEDLSADMFELTQDICAGAGVPAYEVSNHARDGAQSQHNLIYWRYGDYIGIGPGAHGRITIGQQKYATEHQRNPNTWLLRERESERSALSNYDQGVEFLLMGLRLRQGIDMDRFRNLSAMRVNDACIIDLLEQGWIKTDGTTLMVSNQGVTLLNAILDKLISTLEPA